MLKNHSLAPNSAAEKVDPLAGLDDEGLLRLRTLIDLKLQTDLSKIDLAEELGLQYRSGMILLASVQDDKSVPANQRAQVLNSVRTTLSDIIKQQKIVYSAERLKRFEAAVLKVMEMQQTTEAKRVFFDLYGEFLADPEKAPD